MGTSSVQSRMHALIGPPASLGTKSTLWASTERRLRLGHHNLAIITFLTAARWEVGRETGKSV